jgi:Ca2+:H+ antiporter
MTLRRLLTGENALNLLLGFVPAAWALEHFAVSSVAVFACSALAIVPLAGLMGKATEYLAHRLGQGVGGLLNATFGNAAELIIAILALQKGYHDLVKASLTGSIIGNVLLVFGLSATVGGARYPVQKFNRTAASVGSTLLVLSAIGLVVPAIFHTLVRGDSRTIERELSLEISVVLIVTYALSLLFSLRTHAHLYTGEAGDLDGHHAGWTVRKSAAILLIATVLIAFMSEILVRAAEPTARSLGMSEVFIGVIFVAIIGNAAEHSTAVLMAWKNKMDLTIHVAVGSSIQIALFVAPLLVFLSYFVGPSPMDLHFTTFEVLAVVLAVGIMALSCQDGESNWMEGVQLLAVYVIIGIAFYFLPV